MTFGLRSREILVTGLGFLAETREGQARVGGDFPSVRGEWAGRIMTHPMPNTSSTGSSGCQAHNQWGAGGQAPPTEFFAPL